MSKDLIGRKKLCGRCGKVIKDGQAYVAVAENFKTGEEDIVDLLTKNYKWSTYHNTTGPSRVPVVCPAPPVSNVGDDLGSDS